MGRSSLPNGKQAFTRESVLKRHGQDDLPWAVPFAAALYPQ